jgi:hypothetical protein
MFSVTLHILERGQPLTLCGDGRTDTPGHSAKFGSYGILDLYLMMVVDIQLVQVNLFKLLVCSRTFIAQWKTEICLKY